MLWKKHFLDSLQRKLFVANLEKSSHIVYYRNWYSLWGEGGRDDGTNCIYSHEISIVICSYRLVIFFGEVTIIFSKGSRWNTFGAWGRPRVMQRRDRGKDKKTSGGDLQPLVLRQKPWRWSKRRGFSSEMGKKTSIWWWGGRSMVGRSLARQRLEVGKGRLGEWRV